jgi:hypothetical protein
MSTIQLQPTPTSWPDRREGGYGERDAVTRGAAAPAWEARRPWTGVATAEAILADRERWKAQLVAEDRLLW